MDTAFWRSPDTALVRDAFEHLYNAYHPPRPSSGQESQRDKLQNDRCVLEAPKECAFTGEPEGKKDRVSLCQSPEQSPPFQRLSGAFKILRQHSEPDRAERAVAHPSTLRASTLNVSAEAQAAAARQRLPTDRKLASESSNGRRRASRRRKMDIEEGRASGSAEVGFRSPDEVAGGRPSDEQHVTESARSSKRHRKHGATRRSPVQGQLHPAGEERARSHRKLSHGCSAVTPVGPSEQLQQGQVKRKLDLTQGGFADRVRVVSEHDEACIKPLLGGSAGASSSNGVSHDEAMAKKVKPQSVSGRGRTVYSRRRGSSFDKCESPVEAPNDGCGKGSRQGYAGIHSCGRVADLQGMCLDSPDMPHASGRKRETRIEDGDGRKWKRRLADPSGMPVVGDEYSRSIVRGRLTGRCAAADRMVRTSSDLGTTTRDEGMGLQGSKADTTGWLASRRGFEGGSAAAAVKQLLGSPTVSDPSEAPERKDCVANTGGPKDGGKQTPPKTWLMGGLFSPRTRFSITPTPCPSSSMTLSIRPQLARAASPPRHLHLGAKRPGVAGCVLNLTSAG